MGDNKGFLSELRQQVREERYMQHGRCAVCDEKNPIALRIGKNPFAATHAFAPEYITLCLKHIVVVLEHGRDALTKHLAGQLPLAQRTQCIIDEHRKTTKRILAIQQQLQEQETATSIHFDAEQPAPQPQDLKKYICAVCGECNPLGLKHLFEHHHLSGKAFSAETILLCVNCHAAVSFDQDALGKYPEGQMPVSQQRLFILATLTALDARKAEMQRKLIRQLYEEGYHDVCSTTSLSPTTDS